MVRVREQHGEGMYVDGKTGRVMVRVRGRNTGSVMVRV